MRLALRALLLLVVLPPALAGAWQTHVGSGNGVGEDWALAVAIGTDRNIIAAGVTRMSGDTGYATVVKLSRTGRLLWRRIVDPLGSFSDFVAIDAQGNVVVGGMAGGYDESYHGYFTVAKLDGRTGNDLWQHPVPDSVSGTVMTDHVGDVVLTEVRWIPDPQDPDGQLRHDCVKLAGANGSELWRREDCGGSVWGVDAAGDVLVLGTSALVRLSGSTGDELWRATLDLRLPGQLSPPARPAVLDPEGDVVIARGDVVAKVAVATGTVAWRHEISGLAGVLGGVRDFTTDAAGDVMVVGSTPFVFGLGTDFTIVKLSGADGGERWRRVMSGDDSLPGGAIARPVGIEVDRRGNVIVAGTMQRPRERNWYLVTKLRGTTGSSQWSRHLRGAGGACRALAIDGHGTVAVGGALYPPGAEFLEAPSFVVARVTGPSRRVRVYE
jgi:hypothetical protein